jgi:hypothetical protein
MKFEISPSLTWNDIMEIEVLVLFLHFIIAHFYMV